MALAPEQRRAGIRELASARAARPIEEEDIQPVPPAPAATLAPGVTQSAPQVVPVLATSPEATASLRDLITAARVSAQGDPRKWAPASVRLPAGLRLSLKRRVAMDSAATGDYRLGDNHYINVALSQIPGDIEAGDVEEAAAWGLAWRQQHAAERQIATVGSGSRLRIDVSQKYLHSLARWLPTLEVAPRAWEVHAAAMARLLDALAREAPPPA